MGDRYAAFKLPKDSVGTPQLKRSAVTGQKIEDDSVTGAEVECGAENVAAVDFHTDGSVTASTSCVDLEGITFHP